ncbi:MAG TPA: hypothetical protein PKC39_04560 [Ferruginibacter sp.]|nr:hypothetical protein [Ferruginibacter sp.]HMP20212.1 hypothetical protein [Ferruginibacter sp.]
MKGINYLAAFGTILTFAGIFCIKAAVQKNISKAHDTATKPLANTSKFLLVLSGIIFIASGLFLILKAGKLL